MGTGRPPGFRRLGRERTLLSRTEQVLREAIARGDFAGGRLPPATEIAEQLGVSRETVRLAQENLQRDGLLVKYRRKGTLTRPPALALRKGAGRPTLVGYLQADYVGRNLERQAVTREMSGLLLQGAMRECSRSGCRLLVHHAAPAEMDRALAELVREAPLRGVIFASFAEEKLVRQTLGLGLPVALLDHELHLPGVITVREDSRQGAGIAVRHLAGLGHRRIAYAHCHPAELNPWRLSGYRKALTEARLPRRRAWEWSAEITESGAGSTAESLLARSPRPTALICFNNALARLMIRALARRGARVPRDLSVFGIGGEEGAGLSCAQADWFAMGREAVRGLLRAGRDGGTRLFPYRIEPGRTAGPPPRDPCGSPRGARSVANSRHPCGGSATQRVPSEPR